MPRTLRLMEETDLPQVTAAFTEALAPRSAACGINWQHDDERLVLLVETDVPASEVGAVYRETVVPLLAGLRGEFGEFSFEMRALCACGAAATPMMSGDNPEHDMCLCGGCLDAKMDECDRLPNTCPVCGTEFDAADNPGFRANCSAKLESMSDGVPAEMDIDAMRGDEMWKWDCCSRKCALKQFRDWLSKVESHPVAKEARP